MDLFVLHLGSDLGVVLLEAVADALLGGHPLLDAAVDAAGLAGGDGFGGEVVDAGNEAVLNETAESLYRLIRYVPMGPFCASMFRGVV